MRQADACRMFLLRSPVSAVKRADSLRRKKEFRYTYRAGKSTANRLCALVYAKSRVPSVRVGFSVSKKIGGAVVRNRVKRRMREAVSPLIAGMRGGVNVIFVARAPIVDAAFPDICAGMAQLLEKAGLYR